MVDQGLFGRIALSRAAGAPGRKAMLRCVAEYLWAWRTRMFLDFLIPIATFPVIGLVVQAIAPVLPYADTFERWGPFGVVAGWLMWRDNRQQKTIDRMLTAAEKRSDQHIEALRSIGLTLTRMEARPCLFEIDSQQEAEPERKRRPRHGD